jgi:WD40 repeat protein
MHAIRPNTAVGHIGDVGTPASNLLVATALLVAASMTGPLPAAVGDGGPLPSRVLVRIGTDDLRMTDFLTAIAFSLDGRLIAAADANAPSPRVAIFDVHTARRIKQLVAPGGQMGSVQCVTFSPDGARLLWGEMSGEVALWDLKGDRLLFRAKLHAGQVEDVAFSPDGRLMASAGGDVVRLRRAANPAEVVHDLTSKPGQAPGDVMVEKAVGAVVGGEEGFGCLAFTPDGKRLVAGTSYSAAIFVWRIEDGRLQHRIPDTHGKSGSGDSVNPRLNALAVTPDGRRIMSVGQTTELIERTKLKYGSKNVTMSEVRFWDIDTHERLADYRGDEDFGFGYGALSRDGRRVAVADFSLLRILDAATGRPGRTIELPGSWGKKPAFSPDGTLVAMPIGNAVALFEVATGRRLHHDASTPVWYIESAAWSPSSDRIVTGHHDGFVRVWDAATGRLIWH